MKIYLVKRKDRISYDEYDSWVVIAETPKRAKKLCDWADGTPKDEEIEVKEIIAGDEVIKDKHKPIRCCICTNHSCRQIKTPDLDKWKLLDEMYRSSSTISEFFERLIELECIDFDLLRSKWDNEKA